MQNLLYLHYFSEILRQNLLTAQKSCFSILYSYLGLSPYFEYIFSIYLLNIPSKSVFYLLNSYRKSISVDFSVSRFFNLEGFALLTLDICNTPFNVHPNS